MILVAAYIGLCIAAPLAALAVIDAHLARQAKRDLARDLADADRLLAAGDQQPWALNSLTHLPSPNSPLTNGDTL